MLHLAFDFCGGEIALIAATFMREDAWPALPLDAWQDEYATLYV